VTELYRHANFHTDWREISVPWQKIPTFPCYRPTFLESCRRGDFKFTCNAATCIARYSIAFLEGQNFGFWGSLGVPPPKGRSNVRDRYVPSCIILGGSRWHRRRDVSVPLQKHRKQTIYLFPHRLKSIGRAR